LAQRKKASSDEETPKEGVLISAAKAIGAAAGKIAAMAGAKPPVAKKPLRKGKLPPKNKSRLPRLEKKALKKAQAKSAALAK
jgi:hypothetical protein